MHVDTVLRLVSKDRGSYGLQYHVRCVYLLSVQSVGRRRAERTQRADHCHTSDLLFTYVHIRLPQCIPLLSNPPLTTGTVHIIDHSGTEVSPTSTYVYVQMRRLRSLITCEYSKRQRTLHHRCALHIRTGRGLTTREPHGMVAWGRLHAGVGALVVGRLEVGGWK